MLSRRTALRACSATRTTRTTRTTLLALTLASLLSLTACKRKDLAHRVQDRIHAKLPAATVQIVDPATLEVKIGEQKVTASLDNLAILCRNEPARCDETIDRFVQNLVSMNTPELPIAAAEVRAVLRSRKTVEDTRATIVAKSPPDKLADNQLVTSPFQGDMFIVLVRDMPNGIAMLTQGALGTLKLDADQARALGIANLEKTLLTLPTEDAAPGVLRVSAGDSYEAARILVPKLWDGVAKQLKGDLLVIAPTRDLVFAAGSADPTAVARMTALAQKAYDAGPYALSTAMLRRTETGFVPASTPRRP